MGGFNNPVVGALALVRRAIQSPDYAAGSTGWSVNQDGSAEFNDLTVRGTLIVQSSDQGVFVYRGTPAAGTLIVALAAADGTDAYGNSYTRGLWVAGYEVGGFSNQIVLQPPSPAGTAYTNAEIFAQVDGSDAADLFLIGPNDANTGASFPFINMRGANPADGDTSGVTLDADTTQVTGILAAGNHAFGAVDITPSAANTPTHVTVNYGPLAGSNFYGYATADTSVPGTQVTGVGTGAVTNSSMTVTLTRTNTTKTTVFWQVWSA